MKPEPDPSRIDALAGFRDHLQTKVAAMRADLVELERLSIAPDAEPAARSRAEAARRVFENDVEALAHVRATLRRAAPCEAR